MGYYIKNPTRTAEGSIDKEKYLEFKLRTARAVVEYAQLAAPVGTLPDDPHTLKSGYVNKPGDYKRGLRVVVRGDRVYASGTDWKSHWIESGSVNNVPQFPIRRGIQANGLKLKTSSRR